MLAAGGGGIADMKLQSHRGIGNECDGECGSRGGGNVVTGNVRVAMKMEVVVEVRVGVGV